MFLPIIKNRRKWIATFFRNHSRLEDISLWYSISILSDIKKKNTASSGTIIVITGSIREHLYARFAITMINITATSSSTGKT